MVEPSIRISSEGTYYFARKLAQIRKMNESNQETIVNLGIGNPDIKPHPDVSDALVKSLEQENSHTYQPYRGTLDLRTAFAKWYKKFHKFQPNPESEVLPLLGSKEGIMHISMAFINPGDQVLIPNPGYPAYATATRIAGGNPIHYQLNQEQNWCPDLSSLERQDLSKVKLMWINYPHMPTGTKATIELFQNLVEFAKRHKILLCHDNPYSLILNEDPLSILQIDGAKDNAIELTSLSKNYSMAGFRIGAVIGSADHINNILTFKSNMDSGMFLPIQDAAIAALRLGKDWLNHMNDEYLKRKRVVFQILDILGCSYEKDAAGLFVWARIPEAFERAEDYSELILRNARVFITPGHIFGNEGERYLRISLCSNEQTLLLVKQRILKSLTI